MLDHIDEPAHAMRTDVDRDAVFELANDIKKNGLINPITVRPKGKRFEIVAGHRRFLAHRYHGIVKIKCVVRELDDDEAFAVMTSENLAREDVNPVDEATHTKRLLEMYGGDVDKVMATVSRGRDWVENRLAIADMSEKLKGALRGGKIKIGAALALAQITDERDQDACCDMAISQGASLVVVNYWLAQWRAGLFGHASEHLVPDSNVPEGQRRIVMLRCAVDGKEYPAAEFVSMLVCRANVGYVEAIKQHLNPPRVEPVLSGGGN